MPPFKKGLLKRKVDSQDQKLNQSADDEQASDTADEGELIQGILDEAQDSADSENEGDKDAESDGEKDPVLFDSDADSILEDGSDAEGNDSSELEDSEADDSSDEDDDDNEKSDDDGDDNEKSDDDEEGSDIEKSNDSSAESGIGQTHSSEESDKDVKKSQKKVNQKAKVLQKKKQINIEKKVTRSKVSKGQEKDSIDKLTDKIKETSVNIQPVGQKDEYESGDTSDEEDRRNTVGDIPMWWYNEYPHIGYDLDGRKIMKPPQRDQIDEFLKKCEDPSFWRTVRDPATGQDVCLSKEDLDLLLRLRQGRAPTGPDEYEPWVEWFSSEVLATPVRAFPEHKRSFLPSRSEAAAVARLVHALRQGWAKTRRQIQQERRAKRIKQFYNLWGTSDPESQPRGLQRHIPAPRRPLPSHAESYRPPPEYLLDDKERKEWDKLSETPWKRQYTFLPTSHASLRVVPAFDRYIRERFLRCLDLYLAPRAIKMRLTISASDLVPKLPSPRDLQPFPTREVLSFTGHTAAVRSCAFDASGQYVASGSEDGTVKIWESRTGRCLQTFSLGEPVLRVSWSGARGVALLAAASGSRVLLLAPGAPVAARRVADVTDALLQTAPLAHDVVMDERTSSVVSWTAASADEWARGIRIVITHFKPVIHLAWHARGDYLCATLRDAASRSVVVHQLSRRRSQLPFRKAAGLVCAAEFHPSRPLLLVATQRAVRVYDLVSSCLSRRLQAGAQWVTSLSVHPSGDHVLVGTADRKLVWFDLELSSKPYQTQRLHGKAVRAVAFHPRYPLYASAGDDKYIVISHGMVYNDLLQNPLLVPLKQLPAPSPRSDLSCLDLCFHPAQPWLLAAGADATMRLYA